MRFSLLFLIFFPGVAWAQENSSESSRASDGFSLLIYNRVIHSADGGYRVDQSIVGNLNVTGWMRLEGGFRHGERQVELDAYEGYKVEMQSKYFANRVRFIARMSDKVNEYPSPAFTVTNYMMLAEGKFPLSSSVTLLTALGYVITDQHDNSTDAWPTLDNSMDHFAAYKLGLRWAFNERGLLEFTDGSYDVFNPYLPDKPFVQMLAEYELSRPISLYGYFRHQYDIRSGDMINDFYCVGVRVRFR